jgi:peptidoglycan glycosyltransferase
MERRIRRLGLFMVLCFVALFIQLNNIQVFKSNALANSPNNPHVMAVERSQPRGDILSSDGVNLAGSVLAQHGVYKYQRTYNQNTAVLFSQIVGFDSPIYGRTGVEEEYNRYLQSHTRPARSLRDLLVNRTTTSNVTLTINSHLQSQVAAAVDATDAGGQAPQAGAVVMNVKTGAIEAMYSNPTYDPTGLVSPDTAVERFTWASLNPNSDQSPLVSRTFQFGFLPGSTFKTVTTAAVYDRQPALAKVDYPQATCIALPQTNRQLCNYGHTSPQGPESCGGTLNITLPASCDTAFAQLGMALGAVSLTTEAQAFGFNQHIPLDLPGVGVSNFPSIAQLANNAPSQAYSAFGQQDVTATALQMALVADGIANQGVVMTPHVMQQIRDSQGTLVTTYNPKAWLTATSPLTAAAVTTLMQAVVTGGTATQVGFPAQWNVAAKTGTAETGPNATLTNDWMIAFAPANDPKVAAAVVVPSQPGSDTGAQVSGPPMKTILGDALAATP